MKKVAVVVLFVGIIALTTVVVHHYDIYSIHHSEADIQTYLNDWYKEDQPLLLELHALGKSSTVIATYLHNKEKIGAIIFEKGMNRKLKPVRVLENHDFYSELVETNKGTYALFLGENRDLAIKTIVTDIVGEDGENEITIPPQSYFTKIEIAESAIKSGAAPIYFYKTLQGALGATSEHGGMELLFMDKVNQTYMLHSLENNSLNTVLGSFEHTEAGYRISSDKKKDTYSMKGEKTFCFEEKQVKSADGELNYIHGLIPDKKEVEKVVLEVELEDEMIFQAASEVKNQQFLLHVEIPEHFIKEGKVVRKFHLYDREGKFLGTEMKL
ncbi:hypothetical protein JOC95_002704 [Bacillus tianshenii]|uniref:DUF4825 domain-containing protein n=1 Tax=Sutcliffiella tianshenii TaxID=1463404 RepID=A0ABS2P1M4_9BACI|nr:hypothetical protein [Bacillus tianshenii]MBM7620849.1 hypothetical protein [Bacillus tianshenii]